MTEYNIRVEFKCRENMDIKYCKGFKKNPTKCCKFYNNGYCQNTDAQQSSLRSETEPFPTDDFCMWIFNRDKALEILRKIEAVSTVCWCDDGESPSEWSPMNSLYSGYLHFDSKEADIFYSLGCHAQIVTPDQFIAECQRRMPK